MLFCTISVVRFHRLGVVDGMVGLIVVLCRKDTLGSFNHADIAAAILKPFISEENLFVG